MPPGPPFLLSCSFPLDHAACYSQRSLLLGCSSVPRWWGVIIMECEDQQRLWNFLNSPWVPQHSPAEAISETGKSAETPPPIPLQHLSPPGNHLPLDVSSARPGKHPWQSDGSIRPYCGQADHGRSVLQIVSNNSWNDRCAWAAQLVSGQTDSVLYGRLVGLPPALLAELESRRLLSSPRLILFLIPAALS